MSCNDNPNRLMQFLSHTVVSHDEKKIMDAMQKQAPALCKIGLLKHFWSYSTLGLVLWWAGPKVAAQTPAQLAIQTYAGLTMGRNGVRTKFLHMDCSLIHHVENHRSDP